MRSHLIAVITLLLVNLTACNTGGLLAIDAPRTSTPTVVLASFSTPTVTPQPDILPTNTLPPQPTPTDKATRTPTSAPPSLTPTATNTPRAASPSPTATVLPTPPPLAGRIVFPVDDGGGYYDLWGVELPGGEPFLVLRRARQPNFFADGRLLVKTQGSDLGESIGLLAADYTWQGIVNESPEDSYPFWHPDGTRYTYSNGNLVKDPDTAHLAPYIFTACSLQIPRFEGGQKCQDTRQWGKITVGQAPVWTEDDRIAFFSYKGDDGIYFVESASMLREAGGLGPPQLLVEANGHPTDTAGFQLFFSAGNIAGNWEAYAINLDGTGLTNLSNSPISQDGLPAVSPDGNWVAFVSDRDGGWGIWGVPRTGGQPEKIVDISTINTGSGPWGTGHRDWTTERISWGP